jgi:PKD repeat protein
VGFPANLLNLDGEGRPVTRKLKLGIYPAVAAFILAILLAGVPLSHNPSVAADSGLANRGFEDGAADWTLQPGPDGFAGVVESEGPAQFPTYANMDNTTVDPHMGQKMLRLGVPKGPSENQKPGENIAISDPFTIDSGVVKFSFRLFSWEFRGGDSFRFNLSAGGQDAVGTLESLAVKMPDGSTVLVKKLNSGGWGFSIKGKFPNGSWVDSGWVPVTITDVPPDTELTLTYAVGGTSNGSHPTWAYFDSENLPPTSSFTSSPDNPTEGRPIQLTDTSTDPDDNIVAWEWTVTDVNDDVVGQPSAGQNPRFIPPDDGDYTVTLKVTDAFGESSSTGPRSISVENSPPWVKALDVEARPGQDINLFGRFVDQGWNDTHNVEWAVTDDNKTVYNVQNASVNENHRPLVGTGTASAIIPAPTDPPASLTGYLRVTDDGGLETSAEFTITFAPVDPPDREQNDSIITPPDANSSAPNGLYSSYIQQAGDIDIFEILGPDGQALQPGSQAIAALTGLPADYDITLVAVPTSGSSDGPPVTSMDIFPMDIFSMDIFPMDIFPMDIFSMDIFPMDIFSMDIFSMDIFPMDIFSMDIFSMDIFPMDIFPMDIFSMDIFPTTAIRGTDISPAELGIDLPGAEVVGFSANRGTASEQASARIDIAGTRLFAVVSGANGAFSSSPYTLLVDSSVPADLSKAYTQPRKLIDATSEIELFTNDAPLTLFVTQQQRFEKYELNGGDWNALQNKLIELAGNDKVLGNIVSLDSTIYNGWDMNPTSVDEANVTASLIREAILSYLDTHRSIKYVVIVGDDDVVPYRRVPDETTFSNERLYALNSLLKPGSPLYSSLLRGYNLTDDYYVDKEAQSFRGRELYTPDLPIGRLVETPQEIMAAADVFLASGGVLSPSNAFVSGYDFFTDGAQAMADNLAAAGLTVDTLISDNWAAAQLRSNFLAADAPQIDAINAHFAHYAALSAYGLTHPGDVFTSKEVAAAGGAAPLLPGRVIFSLGCHAGLNVPDAESLPVSSAAGIDPALDFPQAFAQQQAVYIASTGFGLGETEGIAGTELLMTNLSKTLVQGNSMVGAALVAAKQAYFGSLSTVTEYDEKSSIQVTLYGLPMYQVQPQAESSNVTTNGSLAFAAITPAAITSDDLTLSGYALEKVTKPNGNYFTADGDSQVTPGHPIQPRLVDTIPQNAADGPVHGALLTAGTFQQDNNFDPVIARPSTGWQDKPQELKKIAPVFWPAQLLSVNSLPTADGLQQTLVAIPGQFQPTNTSGDVVGIERYYDSLSLSLLRSKIDDWVPPAIKRVDFISTNNQVDIDIQANDKSGISRVVVLAIDSDGATGTVSTVYDGAGTKIAGIVLQPNRRFVIQVVDGANNISTWTGKGTYAKVMSVQIVQPAPFKAVIGQETTFEGEAGAGAVSPLLYIWDFGDGTAPVSSSSSTMKHTFSVDQGGKNPIVTLRVIDADGGVGLTSAAITVEKFSSRTVLAASPNPAQLGDNVTLTATVTATSGTGTPTGTITFKDGSTSLGTRSLSNGTATLAVTSLAAGDHTLSAIYSGDANFGVSTGTLTLNIKAGYVWGGFTSPINNSTYTIGRTIPIKFSLYDASGKIAGDAKPEVKMSFADGSNSNLVSLGVATYKSGSYQLNYDTSKLKVPYTNQPGPFKVKIIVFAPSGVLCGSEEITLTPKAK